MAMHSRYYPKKKEIGPLDYFIKKFIIDKGYEHISFIVVKEKITKEKLRQMTGSYQYRYTDDGSVEIIEEYVIRQEAIQPDLNKLPDKVRKGLFLKVKLTRAKFWQGHVAKYLSLQMI